MESAGVSIRRLWLSLGPLSGSTSTNTNMKTTSMQIQKWVFLGTLFTLQLSSSTFAAVEIGTVQASTIGHAFLNPNLLLPPGSPPRPSSVVDYLVDQDQSSGGGGVLPSVSVNWDTNTQFVLTVSAPAGQKFQVHVPVGRAVGFGGFLWWESTRGGFSPPGSVAVRFGGLEGTPPVFSGSESVLSDSHGFFGFLDLGGTTVTSDFAFTSITLTGTVVPQFTGNGTENYIAHHESSMQLFYTTPETNDPGRFVSLVPVDPPPRIRIMAMTPDAGAMLTVQGQVGRTTVVECSSDLVHWRPISTNVMPATVCPSCPSVYVTDAAAKRLDRRFDRVFELPYDTITR